MHATQLALNEVFSNITSKLSSGRLLISTLVKVACTFAFGKGISILDLVLGKGTGSY